MQLDIKEKTRSNCKKKIQMLSLETTSYIEKQCTLHISFQWLYPETILFKAGAYSIERGITYYKTEYFKSKK